MRRKLTRTVGVNCERKQKILVKGTETSPPKIVEIHSKKDRPLWRLFMEFFCSLEIGKRFSRSDLLSATYEKEAVPGLRSGLTSVDTYRSYLRKLGIIEHIAAGHYEKKFNLPVDITLTKVRNASSMNKWQEWFIPLHEKLGIDESDLK